MTQPRATTSPAADGLIRLRIPFLLATCALLYVAFLGAHDMWYPDEPDIAEVAQAMYRSGDWIAPRRNGVIWVDYPPLLYWAGAASAQALGGMSDFALRLPSAVGAILLVLLVAQAAARRSGPAAGLWAGLVLATAHQFVDNATAYRTDMLFSLFLGAGILGWARGVAERPDWRLRAIAFASFGLAMLTKGPLGLLLPGLILTLWHGARREFRRVIELAPWSLLSLTLYLPWFFACAEAMGVGNIWAELWAQNFARFAAGERGHEKPFWYFFANIWPDFAPWSVLLPFALWWHLRHGRWRDPAVQLWLWWFAATFLFLSAAATKRQVYLLPAYPAIALLIGAWMQAATAADANPAEARAARIAGALLCTLFLAFGLALLGGGAFLGSFVERLELDEFQRGVVLGMRWPILAAGGLALAGGFWIFAAWRRPCMQSAMLRAGLLTAAIYCLLLGWAAPCFNPAKTYAPQCRWLREQIGDETHIGLANLALGHHKMGAFGYYSGALVSLIDGPEALARFWVEHPRSLVLVLDANAGHVLPPDEASWRGQVVRELRVARDLYLVLRAP